MAEVLGEDREPAGAENPQELVRGARVLDDVVEGGDPHGDVELSVLVGQRGGVRLVEPDLEAVVLRPVSRVLDRDAREVEARDAAAELCEVDAPLAEPARVVEHLLALDSLPKEELVGAELGDPARRAAGKVRRGDRVPEGLAGVRPERRVPCIALVVEGALLAERALDRRLSHSPSR